MADTDLVAYLLVKGPFTLDAETVFERDPDWVAPLLWRSEFRNVFVLALRHKLLALDDILGLMERAERLMKGQGYQTACSHILRLAADSGCTAYDCEFVAFA